MADNFHGDNIAESAVLAACMNIPTATANARRTLTPEAFFRPDHGLIFAAMVAVDDRHAIVDPVSVYAELAARKELGKVNAAYLHTLYAYPFLSVSWAIRRVASLAKQRERSQLAQRIGQIGAEVDDPDDMSDELAKQLVQLEALIDDKSDDDDVPGLETWDAFLAKPDRPSDAVVPKLLDRQEIVMILAAPGVGKAAWVGTPIATPSGWSTIGALRRGDRVFDEAGEPCTVTAVSPTWMQDTWRVVFDDGVELIVNGAHEWNVLDRQARSGREGTPDHRTRWSQTRTVSTRDLVDAGLTDRYGARRWSVPCARPLQAPESALPIDPYVLGVWLADGTEADGSVTLNDETKSAIPGLLELRGEVLSRWKSAACTYTVRGLKVRLADLGVLGHKHIPSMYLRASEKQRLDLLRGIMDGDGFTMNGNAVGIDLCDPILSRDVAELAESFGWKVRRSIGPAVITEPDGTRRTVGTRWRLNWRPDVDIFAARSHPVDDARQSSRHTHRTIVAVESVPTVPTVCIEVDSPRHLYLLGESLVPTHNSWLSRQVALTVASGVHPFMPSRRVEPKRTLLVDLENPESTVRRQSHEPYYAIRHLADGEAVGDRGWIWTHTAGLNIRKRQDAALLERVVSDTRPDLVCIGSLYNVFARGSSDWDTAAEEAIAVLNRIRSRYGCALWIEHHMPRASEGGHRQSPFGSTLWERWPSYGRVISRIGGDFYDFAVFRGDREAGREFPPGLRRGGKTPWTAIWDADELELIRQNFDRRSA